MGRAGACSTALDLVSLTVDNMTDRFEVSRPYAGGMSAAFWVCAIITAVSAFVSLGFSIAGMAAADASSRTSSMYASARSLALVVTATVALLTRSNSYVEAIAVTMVIVQAVDAVIGVRIRDRLKTVGPAATALVNAAALVWLLRQ